MKFIICMSMLAQATNQLVMPPRAVEPDHIESRTGSAAQRSLLYVPGSDYDRAFIDACVHLLADPYAHRRVAPQFLENCVARLSLFATPPSQDASELSTDTSSEASSEAFANTFSLSVDVRGQDKGGHGVFAVKNS